MILKAALNHSDISVTQKYLEVDEDEVMAAIAKCDFSRGTRKKRADVGSGPLATLKNEMVPAA